MLKAFTCHLKSALAFLFRGFKPMRHQHYRRLHTIDMPYQSHPAFIDSIMFADTPQFWTNHIQYSVFSYQQSEISSTYSAIFAEEYKQSIPGPIIEFSIVSRPFYTYHSVLSRNAHKHVFENQKRVYDRYTSYRQYVLLG